ncbi:MAG: TonB-dependent receptor [Gammaproteobacteria bacterium]|nr:TonB-dependent receptor [Gammaproteobacteria bacterium]
MLTFQNPFFRTFVVVCVAAAIGFPQAYAAELEEIVVTARKLEETLQNAPVAVSVASGELLESMGGGDLSVVGKMAPNVQFETGQPTSGIRAPTVYIRGMGQDDFIIVEDGAVGVYLDGVYVGRTLGSVFDLVDVERVEVLRGPQGTLFGRNTIGGAISLVSKAPSTEAMEGNFKVGLGEDGYRNMQGVFNLPLGETAAARFSAFAREQDGYVEALQYDSYDLGEEDVWGLRAALRYEPNDVFSADLAVDYSSDRSSPNAVGPIDFLNLDGQPRPTNTFGNWWNVFHSGNPAGCTDPAVAAVNTDCYGAVWDPGDEYATNSVFRDNDGNVIEPEQKLDVLGVHLNLSWDLGWGELKSISAYREFEARIFNDVDFTPHLIFHNNHDDFTQDQFSQELQLSGTAFDDKLDFLVGLFYFEEDGVEDIFNQLSFPSAQAPEFFFQQVTRFVENDSQAIFTQLNYRFTDRVQLTAGMRYSESTKKFNLVQPNILGAMVDNTGELKVEEWTPMFTLSWDVNDDIMTYFTYSEGFRDGGFPARFVGAIPEPLPFYDPEFVENFELGLKMMLADNRVRLNVAAFQMDYDDIQVTASIEFPSAVVGSSTSKDNLGKARIRGLEAELTAAITDNLVVNASLGILDDKIKEVTDGSLLSGSFRITEDNDLPMTPNFNGSIGAEYTHMIDNGGQVIVRADYAFKDDFYTRIENIVETEEKNYQTLSASVRYLSANGRWEVGVWGRNVTDETYYQARRIFESLGTTFGTPTRGRTVYGSVQYNFGN